LKYLFFALMMVMAAVVVVVLVETEIDASSKGR
jgi:hypothetical protein